MTGEEREELRDRLEQAMRPAVDQALANATRPYKRLIVWLGITIAVLMVLVVVQWLVIR